MPDDLYPDHIRVITINDLIADFNIKDSVLGELKDLKDMVEKTLGKDPITGKKVSPTIALETAEILWEWSKICREKAKMQKEGISINVIEEKFRRTQTSLDNFLSDRR